MLRNPITIVLTVIATSIGVVSADRVGLGGQCSQANNRVDQASGNFISDCDYTTYCSDTGTCEARTCRKDEYPLGYNGVAYADFPRLCPDGEFCPDEGSGCLPQAAQGEACQLDRDDQCAPPSNHADLAGHLNVNGSTCLNYVCYYSNVTLGQTCLFENRAYTAYLPDGSSFAYVWSRDNCMKGMYCDGTSLQCLKDKVRGAECGANKECLSYNCANGRCAKAAGDPNHPGSWVYAIVAICIGGLMAGVMIGLWLFHRKSRQERRIKLDQYEAEQTAYRQALLSLSNARQSLMALPKDTPEFVARQSLYSLDGYTGQTGSPGAHGYSSSLNPGDSPPPSRRPSSMMQQSWSAEEQGEEDVLIIPSSNTRR